MRIAVAAIMAALIMSACSTRDSSSDLWAAVKCKETRSCA